MRGGAVDLQHGVTILSFIYTRCPDPQMCPLVTLKFGRMLPLLAGTPIALLEVTLDPAYDTPPVLRRYARAVGADGTRWTLATGEPRALEAFAERAGLLVARPRPGVITHTEAVLIVRDGVVEENIGGNDWTAAEIAAEARSVAALPADPLQRALLRAFGGLERLCGIGGAHGVTPAQGLAVFLVVLGAALWFARRLLRSMLAG